MQTEISTQVLNWRLWDENTPEWEHLYRSRPGASIFLSPEWVGCWLESYGPQLKPELVFFRRGPEAVGACLLVFRTRWIFGLPLRQVFLNCAGEDLADTTYIEFNSLLCKPGFDNAVADALAAHLAKRGWDILQMPGMLSQDTALQLAGSLGRCEVLAKPTPYVDFAPYRDNGGDFISGLSSSTRKDLRRSQRSYEAIGGPVTVNFARTPDEAIEMLDQMATLHQATWNARGLPGCFSSETFTGFHKRFIRKHFDHTRLIRVQAGNEVIGILHCLLDHGRVLYYQSGFCYTLDRKSSPGKLTDYLIIVECMKHPELKGFDFMAGNLEYKRVLAGDSTERALYWCIIHRKTPAALFYRMLRRLKKRFSEAPKEAASAAPTPDPTPSS